MTEGLMVAERGLSRCFHGNISQECTECLCDDIEALSAYEEKLSRFDHKEHKARFFEGLRKDTRYFSGDEYEAIYFPARAHWGVNSPAFVFPKSLYHKHPQSEILPTDIEGTHLIAIDRDSVPDPDFLEYLTIHEYWEIYGNRKPGFNLSKPDANDFMLPILERVRPTHRLATLREFQAAQADGKLDEYMEWWRSFYDNDVVAVEKLPDPVIAVISRNYGPSGSRETIIEMIKRNKQLKEQIYLKVKAKAGYKKTT